MEQERNIDPEQAEREEDLRVWREILTKNPEALGTVFDKTPEELEKMGKAIQEAEEEFRNYKKGNT